MVLALLDLPQQGNYAPALGMRQLAKSLLLGSPFPGPTGMTSLVQPELGGYLDARNPLILFLYSWCRLQDSNPPPDDYKSAKHGR